LSTTTASQNDAAFGLDQPQRRLTTETKGALKTTEFFAFVGMVLAVVITANFYDGDGGGTGDPFGATTAMRYVVYLTIGYMVARGIAKSGSRERYDA
jgi:hypothetical protein